MNKGVGTFRLSALVFGFAFLYIPILSLIVYSFNKSRLVTVWGGFSTQWYGRLFENQQILDAAWLSLKVAAGPSVTWSFTPSKSSALPPPTPSATVHVNGSVSMS